jgi:hypothetical protein
MLDRLPKMFGGSTAVWWLIEHTEYTGRGITGSGSAKSSRDTVNSLKWRQAVIKGATYQCLQHVLWRLHKDQSGKSGRSAATRKLLITLSLVAGRMLVDEADHSMGKEADKVCTLVQYKASLL